MSTLRRLDANPLAASPDDIFCFCVIRDEHVRLPYFLDYHRRLGVRRFFVVDNESSDASQDFLLAQPDVYVFFTEQPYSASRCGVDWVNELLNRYAIGHWALTLDADEFLVYPDCESRPLSELASRLEHLGVQALTTFLLDMYSDRPIGSTHYSGGDPLQACPYFDASEYELGQDGLPVRGGPRHRLFWDEQSLPQASPYLRKFPFAKWMSGLAYEASTHILGIPSTPELTGALLHFKLFAQFFQQSEREAARKEHWNAGAQYAAYWRVLSRDPEVTAFHPGARRFRSSADLVAAGLIRDSAHRSKERP